MSAYEVTDLFGEVLGVVAGAFQCLGQEEDVEAFLAGSALVIFQMPQEDEVAQAIKFGVGAAQRARD